MSERFHRTWIDSERLLPQRFIRPVLRFTEIEASGGIVLLAAALVALAWANSPFHESYFRFWDLHVGFDLGFVHVEESLRDFVNDGLMAVFFFVVGLEIKRELVSGELRDPRTAALPAVAALGGMVVPAAIYLAFTFGTEAARGWGIPMATDIAFSLGVISLVGPRVSTGAKLFLLALAVVDDVGVIAVIAIFYTEELHVEWLAVALVALVAVSVAREVGIRAMAFYVPIAFLTWLAFLESGVHATLAGVALGLLTPAVAMYSDEEYQERVRGLIERSRSEEARQWAEERIDAHALTVADVARESVSPLNRLEEALHPWTSFVIVPVFALANSGVRFADVDLPGAFTQPVTLGVALGLLVGKTVGVSLFSALAVWLGIGRLPSQTTWRQMVGVGALAGIGFTVSIFVTGLSFQDVTLSDQAKLGIFVGSAIAGILGYLVLRSTPSPGDEPPRP